RMNIPAPRLGLDYRVFIWQPLGRLFKIWLNAADHFFHHFSLPNPYTGGNIKDELLAGRAGMLSLVAKKGFYRRFVKAETDPIQHLIEMQRDLDRSIYIIPQIVFYGKKSQRSVPTLIDILFGPEQRPGWLRRLTILVRRPGKVFVEVSEPIDLKAYSELPENEDRNPEAQARALRADLLTRFNRHRQSIVGPVLKSREEMKENILNSDDIRRFMTGHAENRDLSMVKVRKKADAHLEEIAAQYSLSMIKIASGTLTWITRLMFDGFTVNKEMLNRVKTMSLRGPVILVPCHKSHIDYLILSYILYHNDMFVPHIAAGKNLSFWPMGPIFRGCGAFFLRRTFKGAVLYSRIFAGYIRWLLEQGFFIEFFIEGTRSRTGKLLTPKLGLLSILLDAYRSGAVDDLIFAPVFVGYDQVLEESSYLHELEGGKKEQENLRQVISARKFLKKRYGKIYVEFSQPMSLKELLAGYDTPLDEMTPKERNALCRYIGVKMLNGIDEASVV
ncbi:MAG: glycerol-3-phosphate acyltransferase, partial [Desulfobacterales bacterium]|nr:glycerol-3-phosphate acyltransferase [Desulfobacterales bacterium]